jgi:hypothetical protein
LILGCFCLRGEAGELPARSVLNSEGVSAGTDLGLPVSKIIRRLGNDASIAGGRVAFFRSGTGGVAGQIVAA